MADAGGRGRASHEDLERVLYTLDGEAPAAGQGFGYARMYALRGPRGRLAAMLNLWGAGARGQPDRVWQAAGIVDKIMRGVNVSEIPVEQATTVRFVFNVKTATALGLRIPPSLLGRADEVIQ